MSIIIWLIIAVSIASNEASALVNQQSYWLYYILWYTKSQLIRKTWYIMWLYFIIIIGLLLIFTPIIIIVIYKISSILTWSNQSLPAIMWWVWWTIIIMVISYRGFHKHIIQKLTNKQQ
jgi:ABC-type multidrug transport system fused ATPase/permease subunit